MGKTGATSKASKKNQTTIPARVRQALGISKGDTLLWTVNGSEVSIRVLNRVKVDWGQTAELSLLEWTEVGDTEVEEEVGP